MQWRLNAISQCVIVLLSIAALAIQADEVVGLSDDFAREYLDNLISAEEHAYAKRDFDGSMPGVLRFGKRSPYFEDRISKKEVPGVLRFGKRSTNEKKSVPGVLRFGKRDIPGLLRFGKRDEIPGVLRFGKRSVDFAEDFDGENFVKKSMPGVLRFGRK